MTHRRAQALAANVQGLVALFAMALPSRLLYRFERLQYAELFAADQGNLHLPSIYGAEFLVRLFGVLRLQTKASAWWSN